MMRVARNARRLTTIGAKIVGIRDGGAAPACGLGAGPPAACALTDTAIVETTATPTTATFNIDLKVGAILMTECFPILRLVQRNHCLQQNFQGDGFTAGRRVQNAGGGLSRGGCERLCERLCERG